MWRIQASARAVFLLAIGAAPFLIASDQAAVAQFLDPGWQIVYGGQASYGGVIDSMFNDGTAPLVVAPLAQPAPPAPMYYQPMSAPQPRVYQPAQVYYQQTPAPLPRAVEPASAYYQLPAQQLHAYQPPPVYYQQAPAPLTRAAQPASGYYQQAPVQRQSDAAAPAPVYDQRPPQQQQARAHEAEPQYTSAIPRRQGAAEPASPPAPKQRGLLMQAQAASTGVQTTPPSYRLAQQSVGQSSSDFYERQYPAQQGAVQSGWRSYPPPQPPPPRGLFQLIPLPQPPAAYYEPAPAYAPSSYGDMAHPAVDPQYDRQLVDFRAGEPPGTIVVDTRHYFLYLVTEGSKAIRYGIGVGREGFTWSGVNQITAMREWPDWRPPVEMLERRPDLPRYMPGGPENPLGARALYLGSTLYRIHGSNEPWTIGTNVSSGCIRLRNADIIDLYSRVKVGTKVVVM